MFNSLQFCGEDDDPYEWVAIIDKYFTSRNLPEEHRILLVFYHLEGEALAWFKWLETNGLLTTWRSFLQMVKLRFGSKFEDPEVRLVKLSQVGSVADYQYEFEEIRSRVTGICEALLISFYISGSKLHIRKALQLNRPWTLQEAFELARKIEKEYESQAKPQIVEQDQVTDPSKMMCFVKQTKQPPSMEELEEIQGAKEVRSPMQTMLPMEFHEVGQDEKFVSHVAEHVQQIFMSHLTSSKICDKHGIGLVHQDSQTVHSFYKLHKSVLGYIFSDAVEKGNTC